MKRAFIVGINGFLGSTLRDHLQREGWVVEGSTSQLDNQGQHFDFKNPKPFTVSQEFDVVIYCSYVISFKGLDPNLPALKMLRQEIFNNAKLHVFISSVSVVSGDSTYAKSKRQAESLFAKDIIVRPGLIMGPGGLYETMSRQVKRSLFFPMFDGGHYRILTIEIGELKKRLMALIERGEPCVVPLVQQPLTTMKQMYFQLRGKNNFPLFIYVPTKPVEVLLRMAKGMGSRGAAYALDRIQGLKANDKLAASFTGRAVKVETAPN